MGDNLFKANLLGKMERLLFSIIPTVSNLPETRKQKSAPQQKTADTF
jgi:hypothetical protein